MQRIKLALGIVLLCGFALSARFAAIQKPHMADFQAYETAAALVLHGHSDHLYDGEARDRAQLRFAAPQTVFAQQGKALGIPQVFLYLYPPLLADALLPFGSMHPQTARPIWFAINLLALFGTAVLVAALIAPRRVPAVAGAVLLFFITPPVVSSLFTGQITLILLLLWTAGIYCHRQGRQNASAVLLATAGVIKLTPLLVVVPFLMWREWRWCRAWLGTLAVLLAGMLLVNGSGTVWDYLRHIAPSVADGIPTVSNKSIPNAVQMLYAMGHGGNAREPFTGTVPHTLVLCGKASAGLVLLAFGWGLMRLGRHVKADERILVLALLALLSTCIAPVAWDHAYTIAFLPLGLLWARAWREKMRGAALVWLTLASVELASLVFDSVAVRLLHGPMLAGASAVAPLTGIALVLASLRGLPGRPLDEAGLQPISR